ncbi:hypothetical protein ACLKA6_013336 [Drosophila palustris]
MTDPSIGSSSPNWASLISNGSVPNFITELPESSVQKAIISGPTSESAQDVNVSGQMSPYAPVFHPMGSYASHLLALEQAAQINMQSPRPIPTTPEAFYDRPEIFSYKGPKPMHPQIFHCPLGNWQRNLQPRELLAEAVQQVKDTAAIPQQPNAPPQEYTDKHPSSVTHEYAEAPQLAAVSTEYWRESEPQVSPQAQPQLVPLSHEFWQNVEPQGPGLTLTPALPPSSEYFQNIEKLIVALAPHSRGPALPLPRECCVLPQSQAAPTALALAIPPATHKQWQDLASSSQLTFGTPQHLEYWASVKPHPGSTIGSTQLPIEHGQPVPLTREWRSNNEQHSMDWWSDMDHANVVESQQPQAQLPSHQAVLPSSDWWPEIEQKSATVPSLPPFHRNCHAEAELQQSQSVPVSREWWQAAAFTPQREHHPVQPVQVKPVQPSEWKPYSYAPLAATHPIDETKQVSALLSEKNKQTDPDTADTPSNPRPSRSGSPSTDFPSFEDFARQVSDCSLSSSEYIATLRNLMLRAHNLMLPLLRGRFANMTQVQMAAYTTAILEVTPLHPSLFLPSNVPRPWTSSGGRYPACHPYSLTTQDLSDPNPRPMLVNASTQTEYHCWCMHMSMYPPPPLHVQPPAAPPPPPPPPAPSRSQANPSAHFAAPNGPRIMAPCGTAPLSFWGRPIMPVHAYPHAHQMARPHGSRYGYRINTYSLPYRFGPVGSSRSRHMGNMPQGAAMQQTEHLGEDNASTERSNSTEQARQQKQQSSQGSSPSESPVIHKLKPEMEKHHHMGNCSSVSQCCSLSLGTGTGTGSRSGSGSGSSSPSDSSSVDSKVEDLKETIFKLPVCLPVEPTEDKGRTETTSPNRVIVKQVNNIFLQPTGPVMPTVPMMPMMHFVVSPGGGHSADAPYIIYDMNENYVGNTNFAQLMPNINMNMNMNINMLPNAMHHVHVMSPDATGMPEMSMNMMNPPIMVPLSSNMTNFKPATPSTAFMGFDLHESGLNLQAVNPPDASLMQVPSTEAKDEKVIRNESHANVEHLKERIINPDHDDHHPDDCDQLIGKLSTTPDSNC